ncbi:SURF1 family protein [Parendozoicomonas sp. Alg238-R29]|uniref:SURF1 family protein n=1 Tax=Parendozoicomonas sp. Alg238-R29 TaxID=2993446 RepID=UPI00248F026C|nr:SURF1 family protein [Parendozoicomonas sp. Alg238-R29]
MYRIREMYRIRIVLLVVALLPVLVGLGFWQLERYDSKLAMENQYQERRGGTYSVSDLKGLYDPLYFQLTLAGRFDNSRSFLLDNRTFKGRVGFHVLTPFFVDSGETVSGETVSGETVSGETVSGETVIVDRGWIVGIPDRSRLPDIPAVDGKVLIAGQSWQPAGEAFLLAEDVWSEDWPKVIQAIDQERMQEVLGVTAESWLLVQDNDQPGSLEKNFFLTNMPASRHFGYAMQWFAMALVLVVLGFWALRKDKSNNKQAVKQELP